MWTWVVIVLIVLDLLVVPWLRWPPAVQLAVSLVVCAAALATMARLLKAAWDIQQGDE